MKIAVILVVPMEVLYRGCVFGWVVGSCNFFFSSSSSWGYGCVIGCFVFILCLGVELVPV